MTDLSEMQRLVLATLRVIHPDALGYRWDSSDETLFLIDEQEEMESGEFSSASLTRYQMNGLEDYLLFHNIKSHTHKDQT